MFITAGGMLLNVMCCVLVMEGMVGSAGDLSCQ